MEDFLRYLSPCRLLTFCHAHGERFERIGNRCTWVCALRLQGSTSPSAMSHIIPDICHSQIYTHLWTGSLSRLPSIVHLCSWTLFLPRVSYPSCGFSAKTLYIRHQACTSSICSAAPQASSSPGGRDGFIGHPGEPLFSGADLPPRKLRNFSHPITPWRFHCSNQLLSSGFCESVCHTLELGPNPRWADPWLAAYRQCRLNPELSI